LTFSYFYDFLNYYTYNFSSLSAFQSNFEANFETQIKYLHHP